MVWPMIAAAAISVIGGAMQGRGAEKASDKQAASSKEIERIRGQQDRLTSSYQVELADYYNQLTSQRNRNARASMYDKYSAVQKPNNFVREDLASAKPKLPVEKGVV